MNIFNTKVTWTLGIAIAVAVVNVIVPFLNPAIAGTVTTVLAALALIFHVKTVNTAAQASAKAGVPTLK